MKYIDDKPTRTLVLLKPDALERGFVGEILKRFERKGLKIVKAEMRWADEDLAKAHYDEHKGNPNHFKMMVEAISRGPVIAVILEGPNVIKASRQLIGNASPIHDSQIGTIRADLAMNDDSNLVHGSDSYPAAQREISLWFSKADVNPNSPKLGVKSQGGATKHIMFPPKKKFDQQQDKKDYHLPELDPGDYKLLMGNSSSSMLKVNDLVPTAGYTVDDIKHQFVKMMGAMNTTSAVPTWSPQHMETLTNEDAK